MGKISKSALGVGVVLSIVLGLTVIAYAGFNITTNSFAHTQGKCGVWLGSVQMTTVWDYYDGDYVRVNKKRAVNGELVDDVLLTYVANQGTAVSFGSISNSGESGSSTTVSADYYTALGDSCYEYGRLESWCDVWGETEDSYILYYRGCNHLPEGNH